MCITQNSVQRLSLKSYQDTLTKEERRQREIGSILTFARRERNRIGGNVHEIMLRGNESHIGRDVTACVDGLELSI